MAQSIDAQTAVIWGTRRITWGQLNQYCVTVIGHLKGLGVKPGDRVAVCAPTCTEYIIVLFAAWRMKVVVAPINHRWPATQIVDYLSCLNASLLLTTHAVKTQIPHLVTRTLFLNEVVGFDARKDGRVVEEAFEPGFEQEATIIATSGSSAKPKPALHCWGNHYFNAIGSQELIPVTASDRWVLSLPLFHVSGIAIIVRCFLNGATIVIPVEDALYETIIKRQVTHVSLVAAQLFRLMREKEGIEALKQLKYILLGGSSISTDLMKQAMALKLNCYLSYGLTEMASQVATGKAGACVKALLHRELKIAADGEVLVKGPCLFKGYIQAGRIQLPLTEDGWFKTGDLGSCDKEGCLTISGRKDNMFISGGENIQPEEIEKVLLQLAGVEQVVIVPKEDPEFGQRPVAFVKCADNAKLTQEHMLAHCHQLLPAYQVPIAFYQWPDDLIGQGLKISRKDFLKISR